MKVYIAGGMSGYPQSNFPAFYAAAEILRAQGWDIVSPAELDDAETVARALADAPATKTWGDFLSRDIKLLADEGIQGIVFLPGWQKSKGARLEAYVGLNLGFNFFEYDGDKAVYMDRQRVIDQIYSELSK